MSRRFNDVRSSKKALSYGFANGLGPFRLRPKKKKTAASASNTDNTTDGKETAPPDARKAEISHSI